jgi:putative transposase
MSGEETVRRTRHARALLETWRIDYNTNRPHSRLGWMSPTAYAVHSGPLR